MTEITGQILDALVQHYGKSKYYDFIPDIFISDEDSILSGEFRPDWEMIVLYRNALLYGPEELATVINHEYIHYLQSPTWLTRYGNTYDYYNNPYEVEAYTREEEWRNLPKLKSMLTSKENSWAPAQNLNLKTLSLS